VFAERHIPGSEVLDADARWVVRASNDLGAIRERAVGELPGDASRRGFIAFVARGLNRLGVRRGPWSGALTRALACTPPGTRTQNLRIKSPLLCQLS
jgi:hypothetical protein